MVENTLDENKDTGRVYGRLLRSKRGDLGDHELVTAPKYCEKWIVDRHRWWRVKQTYQKQLCNNRNGDCKVFQGGIVETLRDSSYVLSVMQLMFLMLIPKL